MKHNSGGPTELLLSRLANVKKSGKGWMASCPAHGGHDCLTIEEKDNKTLVHCFAGCDTRDVVAAVDLRLSDLFADSLNPTKQREYKIQSARSARDHAKLIMDIASAQALESDIADADLATLAAAHETFKAANDQLEELESIEYSPPDDVNPLLKRLAYDSDAALEQIANQQWLIDSVIPADSFGVIFGPSGSYKSFLALDMGASIASSLQWHGKDVDNPGHTIYVAAEGASGLHLRKRAWEIRHRTNIKNLGILGSAVTINSAIECHQLIDLCLEAAYELNQDVKLIIVDTLARSFAGDENSASDMGAFIKACDVIREKTGATVVVIHHSGKDADKGARGSSALRAACDFEYKVTSSGKKLTKLACTKAKDSDPIDDIDFKLEAVDIGRKDSKGREMISLVPKSILGEGEHMRSDLTGYPQTLNDLIAAEMARNGQDFCMKSFVQDSFYHAVGGKSEASRKNFARALDKLISDEWVTMDSEGKIERSSPY